MIGCDITAVDSGLADVVEASNVVLRMLVGFEVVAKVESDRDSEATGSEVAAAAVEVTTDTNDRFVLHMGSGGLFK